MKILVFYVDKQYFNMVILFLRLRVRRELIIRRDGRAVEGTGLENRRCESIRGFESHSLRQLNFSIDLRKYPRGRRGSPAKGVGRVKSAAEVQILSSAPRKARENIAFSLAFSFISSCFAKKKFNSCISENAFTPKFTPIGFFTPKNCGKKLHRLADWWSFLLCLFQLFII